MENAKKQLKSLSYFIFIFAALSVVRAVVGVLTIEITADMIPKGLTEEIVKVATIVVYVCTLVIIIPQLYIGVKGVKLANGGEGSKAQIIWAKVLLVLSVIALISTVSTLTGGQDIFDNVLALIIAVCDVAIYYLYGKYAKQIMNAAE